MTAKHPAPYSSQILDVFRTELASAPWVHDPFAGEGVRLGRLCDELGVPFTGTELEACFILDKCGRVVQGDSRDLATYPTWWEGRRWWIVTSPVYPNGFTDHFVSSGVCSRCKGTTYIDRGPEVGIFDCDACVDGRREVKRHTYRQAAIELSGQADYALDPSNMGRHGVRGGRKAEERYWTLAGEVVEQWGSAERVVLNTKDVIVRGDVYHVTARWRLLMEELDWTLDHAVKVPCPGQRNGANREARVDHEDVLVFVRG